MKGGMIMNRISKAIWIVVLAGMVIVLAGCYSCRSHWKAKGRQVPPEVAYSMYWDKDCVPVPLPVPPPPIPSTECGPYVVSRTYPTTEAGMIKLEKTMPDQVQINAEFDYSIRVTNLAEVAVDDVKVTENTEGNFKFNESDPPADIQGNQLTWSIGALAPGATRQIRVSGSAMSNDCVKNCAKVSYTIPACGFIKVVQPLLYLAKLAPSKKKLCDDIPLTYVVKNRGTGDATNVEIIDELQGEQMTADGGNRINIAVGTLKPGESKEYTVMTRARSTGAFSSKAIARADAGLRAESRLPTTVVTQPELQISKAGPDREYLGRKVSYIITLKNTGDSPATETVLEDMVPAGATNIVVSDGGIVVGDKVIWNLGTIGKGQSRAVSVGYVPSTAGAYTTRATARAICAEGVTVSADTNIEGIAAILLEVVDLSDPIEVGENETYLITVTNQGTKADTNIRINCFLEKTMKFVSASGQTQTRVSDGKIVFQPLDVLEPGEKATWKVVVRATYSGDVRFRVTMDSDQLTRNVEETEATNFYE